MSHPPAIGIDLGTSCCAVARLDEAGCWSMVRSADGQVLTPSVVQFDDAEIIVGRAALLAQAADPARVAEAAQRDLGQRLYGRPIRGYRLPPEVIQACILRQLKRDAAAELAGDFSAVLTVAALADPARRQALATACDMAELKVIGFIEQPTAAALAYAEMHGYLAVGKPCEPLTMLVVALGDGACEAAVIELIAGRLRVVATALDARLGGRDWNERLLQYAADEFVSRTGVDPRHDPAALVRWNQAIEAAKHTLSAREGVDLHVECGGQSCDLPVSRQQFEQLTADLLERALQ